MDHLGVILQGTLSPNPDERKSAEQSLHQVPIPFLATISLYSYHPLFFLIDLIIKWNGTQVQYSPQHLVRLLQIIVDNNCDMGVRQVAAIHFKNFIAKNWTPHHSSAAVAAAVGGK